MENFGLLEWKQGNEYVSVNGKSIIKFNALTKDALKPTFEQLNGLINLFNTFEKVGTCKVPMRANEKAETDYSSDIFLDKEENILYFGKPSNLKVELERQAQRGLKSSKPLSNVERQKEAFFETLKAKVNAYMVKSGVQTIEKVDFDAYLNGTEFKEERSSNAKHLKEFTFEVFSA